MGRRKLQWKRRIVQANGDVDRVLPKATKGTGTRAYKDSPSPNSGAGKTVTLPMRAEKEAWVRKLIKK